MISDAALIATGIAYIGSVTKRFFHFFSDGSILYCDEGKGTYQLYEQGWPYILDYLDVLNDKEFHQLFCEWKD